MKPKLYRFECIVEVPGRIAAHIQNELILNLLRFDPNANVAFTEAEEAPEDMPILELDCDDGEPLDELLEDEDEEDDLDENVLTDDEWNDLLVSLDGGEGEGEEDD